MYGYIGPEWEWWSSSLGGTLAPSKLAVLISSLTLAYERRAESDQAFKACPSCWQEGWSTNHTLAIRLSSLRYHSR